jgi:hypothetical protein
MVSSTCMALRNSGSARAAHLEDERLSESSKLATALGESEQRSGNDARTVILVKVQSFGDPGDDMRFKLGRKSVHGEL